MLKRRSAVSDNEILQATGAAITRIKHFLESEKTRFRYNTIMSYSAFKKEFPTAELNRFIRDAGYTLVLPYTDRDFRIHPLIVDDRTVFRISGLGIEEPDLSSCRETDPSQIDLVIMPGIAFDCQGYRIGFGKGCYDQFLPFLHPDTSVIGLAYDFQVLDRIPAEEHDRKADHIVTERRIINCYEQTAPGRL